MSVTQFHRQMQQIKEDLVKMAGLVEEALLWSIEALSKRDSQLAQRVISGDRRIDLLENAIDRSCLTLLATYQPVAVDLRFLASALKACSAVERMGDQAVNIAQRALVLCELHPSTVPGTIRTMAEIAREMGSQALDSFMREDLDLARKVIVRDDDLDTMYRVFLEEMIQWMTDEHRLIRRGVEYILASRHLERIGDEATNIAEEAFFLVEGRIVRHGGEDDVAVGPL
ncbi:phosphate uptake regulator, PhoU [Desulfarculus baarsii DSM 2075]|uniref:Phosphate-specific transport system accessory protein PhoU n=1 Tax=Desulfarculus baarsii (strain ATCC 33931 / DSM 2075 / LMG 7858 / VKM B-1802 / 2st14) TaxID=644282 RepID=E1QIL0_DESB2|nr:phosphate signaling complex protein PhoU [Desulfarculus baarsii]ADK84433.1 phosphate uptake regulator, PhoU [Desulfarculus baarsii DSM 2075]